MQHTIVNKNIGTVLHPYKMFIVGILCLFIWSTHVIVIIFFHRLGDCSFHSGEMTCTISSMAALSEKRSRMKPAGVCVCAISYTFVFYIQVFD